MKITRWRVGALVGVVAALLIAPFGTAAQDFVAALTCLIATGGMLTGIRSHRPEIRPAGTWLGAAGIIFFVEHGLEASVASFRPTDTGGFSPAVVVSTIAYLCVVRGLWQLGHLRNADSDPANSRDALIIAGNIAIVTTALLNIPMMISTHLSEAAKINYLITNVMDVFVIYSYARLSLAPGPKGSSYWLFSLLPASLLVSDLLTALNHASDGFSGAQVLSLIVFTAGFALSAAASHEQSVDTEQASSSTRITARRLTALTAAVSAPPVALILENSQYTHVVVIAWLAMLFVVIWRISALIRGRADAERVDGVLRLASSGFLASTSRQETFDAALTAMTTLIMPTDSAAVIDLVMIEGGRWRQAATTRSAGVGLRGQLQVEQTIKTILDGAAFDSATSWPAQQTEINGRTVLFAPLVAQNEVRGWVLTDMNNRVAETTEHAFTELCTELGLAIEASALGELLHQQRNDKRFRALIENSNDSIFIIDAAGRPMFTSSAAERILASSGETTNLFQAIHPRDRAAFVSLVQNAPQMMQASGNTQNLECRVVTHAGPPRWIDVSAADLSRDPDVQGIVITAHDVTERKMLENDLRHRVLHDELTGISNRALLRERADHALSMRRSDNSVAAALYIDINEFHSLNERLGQEAGDEILKVIAFRIDNFVRGHDTAARINADTFAVLLQDVANESDMANVADRLMTVIQRPVEFDGQEIDIVARIGVCVARPDYDSQLLLRNADVALHEAKNADSRIAFFSETMFSSASERLELRRDLEQAIENEELVVFYQPIINLHTGGVGGFEALVRWEHPERGLVSPGSFIPLAEETGLIVDIGAYVMDKACSQLAVWRAMRPELDLSMSINIADRQLEEDIVEVVERILLETGIDPSSLVLEMSETGNLSADLTRARLSELRRLGVQIAADDFGGGFSNYPTLEELPFTMVKIDRSLIVGLDTNTQKATIALRKIIDLAHSTNLQVAAEGIEDARQRDLLTAMGVDRAQGYLFGRPVGAAEAQGFVTETAEAL